MADKNSFSLTKITMTPKTARNFCIVGAIVLTLILAIGAVCWTEEGGKMFGNRTSGGGGGGGGGSSGSAADLVDDAMDDSAIVENVSDEAPEESVSGSADGSPDAGADAVWMSANVQPVAPDPR